jgi:hypothetical protein
MICNEVEIVFSDQAEMMLSKMGAIDREAIIKWYVEKKIKIGGGDIVTYLQNMK